MLAGRLALSTPRLTNEQYARCIACCQHTETDERASRSPGGVRARDWARECGSEARGARADAMLTEHHRPPGSRRAKHEDLRGKGLRTLQDSLVPGVPAEARKRVLVPLGVAKYWLLRPGTKNGRRCLNLICLAL